MPEIDLNTGPIDPNDPQYAQMLANLQGNILKSHGRDYTINLFIRFKGKPAAINKWLAAFTDRFVTSALRQFHETQEYKINKISGRAFTNIYLTAEGYRKLGFDPLQLVEEQDGISPPTFFRDGMEATAVEDLSDPPAKTWDAGYSGRKIHAMILVADEDNQRLSDVQKIVEASLKGVADVLVREEGLALREPSKKFPPDKQNSPIEHFGYHDGVSQPLFFTQDVEEEEKKFGIDQWDPSAPLKILLVKDPFSEKENSFGSYFVFRKLEQNVKGFKEREEELAGKGALNLPKPEEDRAGAQVVGRFENGIPALLSATGQANTPASEKLIDFNNFNYQSDQAGIKCPYQAHIRKTNPRGDTGFSGGKVDESELSRRITRRGITYGKRELDKNGEPTLKDRPTKNVGLLFQCFQSSIPNQFGFMQKIWANNVHFARPIVVPPAPGQPDTGLDPVVGQGASSKQHWPTKWDGSGKIVDFDFAGFVRMKGGEYFFAPSIPFLRSLGKELPAVTKDQAEIAETAKITKDTGAKKGKKSGVKKSK